MRSSRRAFCVLALMLLALPVSGCFRRAYPTKSQYVIAVERSGPRRVPSAGVLRLNHVSSSVQYDRRSFVYRTGEQTFADDFYNAFYVAPSRMVSSLLGRWLEASGLFSAVVDASSLATADWVMEARVIDLYVDQRDKSAPIAVVGFQARLLAPGRSKMTAVLERIYSDSEPAKARNGDAYVAAWATALTRALGKLENDLAEITAR